MQIHENFSLKPYNTFGIDVNAKYFATFSNVEQLLEFTTHYSLLPTHHSPLIILGGGSNVLFTGNYNGPVFKNEIYGIHVIEETESHVFIKAGAGENWHEFVMHCIDNGFGGVENLSLIPGSIGAAPIQNIGAYGAELKDVFHSLEAFHLEEKKVNTFSVNDCEFGYRDSIFKRQLKEEFAILNVVFKLNKKPEFNISYGAIQQELTKMNVHELSIKSISQAVINIRHSKLPDPGIIGNAGSFFKNPQITEHKFQELTRLYPEVPAYSLDDKNRKVAAAWLIEQCGPEKGVSWKGFRRGDAGCHEKQALVLVNYGNATGKEIYQLGIEIIQSVKEKFNIELENEVNII